MKITQTAKIFGGQDGTVYGDYLFRFDEVSKCHVYKLCDLDGSDPAPKEISFFTFGKCDLLMPHNNAVCFGKEFFSPDDEFPLLYTNIYNTYASREDKMKGVCAVYRLVRNENEFCADLVQMIEIGFVEDAIWASENGDVRPYGNFVVDAENGIYYGFTMRDGDRKTRYFAFRLPALCEGEYSEKFGVKKVVLQKSDILSYFDCDYHRYIQGACCHKGKIYSLEGFTNDPTNLPAMRIIDPVEKKQESLVLFGDFGLTIEPEFIEFHNGVCYYSDNSGNLYTIEY